MLSYTRSMFVGTVKLALGDHHNVILNQDDRVWSTVVIASPSDFITLPGVQKEEFHPGIF